jgi:hypothetical protein
MAAVEVLISERTAGKNSNPGRVRAPNPYGTNPEGIQNAPGFLQEKS